MGRCSPFNNAPFEIFEVLAHLIKREPERKEAFGHVAGKASRKTVATQRGDLRGIGFKSRFHGIARWRRLTRQQRGSARAQIMSERPAGLRQRRLESCREGRRQRTDGRSSDYHNVVALPEQCAQQRPRVGSRGETCRPLVLGLGAYHVQLH